MKVRCTDYKFCAMGFRLCFPGRRVPACDHIRPHEHTEACDRKVAGCGHKCEPGGKKP